MFGAKAELGDVAHVFFEEGGVASGDDPDVVARIVSKEFERADDFVGGNGGIGIFHNGCKGTIIVEHEEAFGGGVVGTNKFRAVEEGCEFGLREGC